MIQHEIRVSLGERSYPIYIGRGMTSLLGATLKQHNLAERVAIITDTNIARHYLKPIEKQLTHSGLDVSSIVVPPGERQKSLSRASAIFTELLRKKVGRKSTILALGGGVIGDLAGFVAATYHRGVGLIQVPTTLLSQVDSSVGGKVAVNHPLGKNMIGAFYQPAFVWTDMEMLETLPAREIVCGLGEIVKYGVIRDTELFAFLEKNVESVLKLDHEAVAYVQQRCCSIKAAITSEDEKETGVRMILNFGHTVGHALETAGNYRLLKHGEGVLLGMIAESYIANKLEMIQKETYERIVDLIRRIPLRVRYDSLKPSAVLKAMTYDKKTVSPNGTGGKKRFMLPTQIGEVKAVENIDTKLIEEAVHLILKKW